MWFCVTEAEPAEEDENGDRAEEKDYFDDTTTFYVLITIKVEAVQLL